MASDHSKQSVLIKSELIADIARSQPLLSERDVELAVGSILERVASALANGERVEIRGFGSMTLHYRPPRTGRNPKTGEKVELPEKYVPHFKPGAGLRQRVNGAHSPHGKPEDEQ